MTPGGINMIRLDSRFELSVANHRFKGLSLAYLLQVYSSYGAVDITGVGD